MKLLRAGALALVAALVLAWALRADAGHMYKASSYFEFTGQPVTVGWDRVDRAVKYVWRIKSVERQKYIIIDGSAEHETTETFFTFRIPFVGHFVAEVKAVDADGNSSKWAKSGRDEFGMVDGQPKGWWVYGYIAPAGDIEIEQEEN